MTPAGKSLRVHLLDASFHAHNLHRSLSAAADQVQTDRGARKFERLAKTARRWAIRLDPTVHERRDRRSA